MKPVNFGWKIIMRVLLLFAVLCVAALLVVKGWWGWLIVAVPVIIYQVYDFYRFQQKTHRELHQFVEAVHYRDFSRYFDVQHAPDEVKPLRQGFNEINSTIKTISKEKEAQQQYLQKILELVGTGILSYKEADGEVVWMNEALKRMLQVPYLKTIHSLGRRDVVLYEEIVALKPGNNRVAVLQQGNQTFKVLLSATAFQTDGELFKLIAVQNVNEALDETEAKAWQKLLSVLTHEIMNSVAPISSLADTLKNRLQQSALRHNDATGTVEDIELGIDTIRKRSDGLLRFAETYRNLNKVTTLSLKQVLVRDLFENLNQLMQPTLEQKQIELDIILKDPDITIEADMNLMEQVLINLVLNAIEAVKEVVQPRIVLSAYHEQQRVIIKVADNGTGIAAEVLDKIFVPFFSTRKNGSGIGLSLCKQIVMLHKGTLQVYSKEGEGTAFMIRV
jgi:signal transduction histidine kinase